WNCFRTERGDRPFPEAWSPCLPTRLTWRSGDSGLLLQPELKGDGLRRSGWIVGVWWGAWGESMGIWAGIRPGGRAQRLLGARYNRLSGGAASRHAAIRF